MSKLVSAFSIVTALLFSIGSANAQLTEGEIGALIAKMSVGEKLGQLAQRAGGRQRALNSFVTEQELELVRQCKVGSYLHVAGAAETEKLQRAAMEGCRLRIPLLFAMDIVHGYRTIFPVPIGMAASFDAALVEQASRAAAKEASADGLHWTFAPMIDIARDPRWGRIVEGAGEDSFLGARMAAAQVEGYQGKDMTQPGAIMATAKHLGAYGAAEGGRDYGSADISRRTLEEVYLPPFRAAADVGAGSMMIAFNDNGGVPATGDGGLINDIVRDQWGWQGMTVSDWRAIEELMAHGVAADKAAAGSLALDAGVDMDMISGIYGPELEQAVSADPRLGRALDKAVRHVLQAKSRMGLFGNWKRFHDPDAAKAAILTPANRLLARQAAERSAVLLKNDRNVLPLSANGSVALIGDLAADRRSQLGSWKARGEESEVVSLKDALARRIQRLEYVAVPDATDAKAIAAAVAAARRSERVIVTLGEHYDQSGEARSRSDISLSPGQKALAEALIATGKPVIVVLMTGRPMAITELGKADAILLGWYGGIEGGNALADLLLGDANPAGRLPASFPRSTGQIPVHYDQRPSGRPANLDLAIDSNRYRDVEISPLYAFGHGLSYSRFEYGPMKLSSTSIKAGGQISVSIDITNTSQRRGDEVVQLYMRDPVASVARPVKQLRGFARVALAPGQTRRVQFTLSASQFALYNGQGRWAIERGKIELLAGAASDDIRQSVSFEIVDDGFGDRAAAAIATAVLIEE